MPASAADTRLRTRAFEWLAEQVDMYGDVLPRDLLAKGFVSGDQRIPLVGPQGIFKPQALELPLSITTAPSGPYLDAFGPDELLQYRYRGTDPNHRDNAALRECLTQRVPLAYFHGIMKGKYVAAWPVFVVGDDPQQLTFTVAVDDARVISRELLQQASLAVGEEREQARREYVTRLFQQRLHQRSFRERVLLAYQEQCALCRLRHQELLDAAHIVPDVEPEGEPIVANGLALCKLHHAAFDRQFVGVRDDYTVEVRQDVLEEEDGPMLIHGLQGLHGTRIVLPRKRDWRPDPVLLSWRYERFQAAG